MLSLIQSSDHVSSYETSPSYSATLQSSYGPSDYTEYSAANWPSEDTVYPSPPMSSSPSGTFPGQARGLDPYAGRYVHHPGAPPQDQPWGHPVAYQGAYSQQHAHQHQHQLGTGPSPRSPRAHYALPTQHVLPQAPGHANYAYQPQMVRGYPTPDGAYPAGAGMQPAQPTTVLGSSTPGPKPTKQQRRTKAHVVTACHNCKKAHLSCEEQRPCQRCKSSGKTDSCFNVAHKRRGRPRIRDGPGGNAKKQNGSAPTINTGLHPPHLKSNDASKRTSYAPDSAVSFSAGTFDSRITEQPKAFLSSDFVIVRANAAFKDHFDYERDTIGRSLEELIDSSDKNTLTLLRDSLKEEKEVRSCAYLAPLKTDTGLDALEIPAIETLDFTTVTAQGYTCRDSNLRFRFRGGNVQNLTVMLQLAKTNQFFIVLTLPALREDATPAVVSTFPPQAPQHPVVPQVNTSSFPMHSSFPVSPQLYSAQPVSAVLPPHHRVTHSTGAANSAPASPYYTLGNASVNTHGHGHPHAHPHPHAHAPMSAVTASPMTPGRTPYEQQFMYQGAPMYPYPGAPAGGPNSANSAEPRHFQAYGSEQQGHGVPLPYPGAVPMPQAYSQLPPIYAQQQRDGRVYGQEHAYGPPQGHPRGQLQLRAVPGVPVAVGVQGRGVRMPGVKELAQ